MDENVPPVGSLDGIRVLDWTVWQQGPAASAMLGDLGADVIKIEERGIGDPGRALQSVAGLDVSGIESAYFEVNNRNKKSVALDLRKPKGVALVHRLVAASDVFIHNFRPGVPERLGLDYPTLRTRNPRLIYGAASAYGARGEEKSARAYDLLGLARSGIMDASGSPTTGEPGCPKGAIADQVGAIALAYGVLAAIVARERHGMGQRVDSSLLGSMMWLQNVGVEMQLRTNTSSAAGSRSEPANPLWNYYRCADGKWIAFAMPQSDRFWFDLVEILGRPELAADERFADQTRRRENARICVEILDDLLARHPRRYWLDRMAPRPDLPVTPINSMAEVISDPQVEANDYIVEFDHPVHGIRRTAGFPIAMSETPPSIRDRAPEFGEHTETVLMEVLGLGWEDFDELRKEDVI